MRALLVVCAGCMVSGGPALGYRQGHATIGFDIGAGLPFARFDFSRTDRIGGPTTDKAIDTYMLNFVIPARTDPVALGGVVGLGAGSLDKTGTNGALSAGGFVAHAWGGQHSDRPRDENLTVVGAAAGVRYMPTATELYLTPQLGWIWLPGIGF